MNKTADIQPGPETEPAADDNVRLWLRLLATSDIHANLLPYDYSADKSVDGWGLARTASLIDQARSEITDCLLLDNGDFLQGTPLADLVGISKDNQSTQTTVHPVIAAMNRLGYDAIALGNHEFNFGLDALHDALAESASPVICANALTHRGQTVEEDETLLPPSVLIERRLTDSQSGKQHLVRIGLLGLLPPQIATWDKQHLGHAVTARDMVETAAVRVPALRAAGADIVVLLAHTGIDPGPVEPYMENAALALARVPGVDAIIAGHSHEVFPRPEMDAAGGADHRAGTLHGVPAVMPGYRGSHLGVLDLQITRRNGRWQVTQHRAEARPVAPGNGAPPAPPHPAIIETVQESHAATLLHIQRPLAQTARPVHSYLSLVRSDLPVRLVAEAQRQTVAKALADGPYGDLPVLSASAPYRTGGRAGPTAFTDIPAGVMTLRSATDLYPFPNTLCALSLTGAELHEWLERAASCYLTIRPGVTYQIDVTAPPLYTHKGVRCVLANSDLSQGRIRDLRFNGARVKPDARFILAVNNYRAFGGGPYANFAADCLVLTTQHLVRDILAEFLAQDGLDRVGQEPAWRLLPVPGATAVIETGPGFLTYADEMNSLGLVALGEAPNGFLRLSMPLYH